MRNGGLENVGMNMKKKLTVGAVICSMMSILLAGCSDDSGAKNGKKLRDWKP